MSICMRRRRKRNFPGFFPCLYKKPRDFGVCLSVCLSVHLCLFSFPLSLSLSLCICPSVCVSLVSLSFYPVYPRLNFFHPAYCQSRYLAIFMPSPLETTQEEMPLNSAELHDTSRPHQWIPAWLINRLAWSTLPLHNKSPEILYQSSKNSHVWYAPWSKTTAYL